MVETDDPCEEGEEGFIALDVDPYVRDEKGAPKLGQDGKPLANVSNMEMGYIFEELIRKFSEQSNETAGEHFTPREVIKFMGEHSLPQYRSPRSQARQIVTSCPQQPHL